MDTNALYERDFYGWIQHHIELLKQGKLEQLEVDILIDELESMGKRDKRELVSHFIILIAHLLKWQFQPHQRSNSWQNSIDEPRIQITRQLEDSPSLKPLLPEAIAKAYPDAVNLASRETRLSLSTFSPVCPYRLEQLRDEDFYPSSK
jgi:hypothetical protein